jgi:hypothetical protein
MPIAWGRHVPSIDGPTAVPKGIEASFDPNRKSMRIYSEDDRNDFTNIMHEITHMIQRKEGMMPGTSVDTELYKLDWLTKLPKSELDKLDPARRQQALYLQSVAKGNAHKNYLAELAYKHSPGEIEAKANENIWALPPENARDYVTAKHHIKDYKPVDELPSYLDTLINFVNNVPRYAKKP